MNLKKPLVLFIMGVSGVGKSTIGKLLSKQLSIPFFDSDISGKFYHTNWKNQHNHKT